MLSLEQFSEKACCCLVIALGTGYEVQCIALQIYGSLQIFPDSLDFDVCLINPPRIVPELKVRLNAFVQFWQILQYESN
jgi:hypothetical protein